jgi:hypothetical protein
VARRLALLAGLTLGAWAFAGCGGGASTSATDTGLTPLGGTPSADGTAFGRLGEALPSGAAGDGLGAILTAAGKDKAGHPVGPANRFAPTAARVAVLVHVGALPRPGRLAIDWYAVGADGKERLLADRRLAVRGRQWAWSVGRAPGPVQPGLYEIVARLRGSERATWFTVGDLEPPKISTAATVAPAPKPMLASDTQAAPTSEWDSWNDGTVPDAPAPAAGGSQAECDLGTGGTALAVDVDAWAGTTLVADRCGLVTLSAGISGGLVQQASGPEGTGAYIDPCDLPGGTDAPGTVVQLAGSSEQGAQATGSVELIDLGLPPMVLGQLQPPDGTKVHPGNTIKARVGAVDVPFASGIHKVDIYGDGELIGTWTRPDGQAKPCNKGRFAAAFDVSYTVPAKPPPVVEIYARAEDYAGHFGWAAWHFPTQGTTWTGKVVGHIEQQVPSGNQIGDADVTVTLTEDAEGKITGVLDGTQTQDLDLETCPSTTSSPGRIHAQVSGTHEGDTVSLELGAVEFTPPGVTPCPGAGPPATMGSLIDPLFPPLGKALAAVVRQDDGTFHAEASGTSGSMYPYTDSYTVDLKPTGD